MENGATELERKIYEALEERASKPQIINPDEVNKMNAIKKLITRKFKSGYEIVTKIGDPFPYCGSIRVIGKSFEFEGTELIKTCYYLCDAIDFSARTDGNVVLTFTFSNMTDVM